MHDIKVSQVIPGQFLNKVLADVLRMTLASSISFPDLILTMAQLCLFKQVQVNKGCHSNHFRIGCNVKDPHPYFFLFEKYTPLKEVMVRKILKPQFISTRFSSNLVESLPKQAGRPALRPGQVTAAPCGSRGLRSSLPSTVPGARSPTGRTSWLPRRSPHVLNFQR